MNRNKARKITANWLNSTEQSIFENLADGVTVKELALKMRIPVKTVYDWIYRKSIPRECILRINGRVRFNSKAVEAWLLGQQV